MRTQVPEVVAPIHIALPLRDAGDLATARTLAIAAAKRALLRHDDVGVHHIIVREDAEFHIISAEGPPALLDPASRQIASSLGAEVVVAATRTGGGEGRLEWFDSSGHSETVAVSPGPPRLEWLVQPGVTKISAAARVGYPTVAAAVEYLVAETKAAADRGELDIEAHVVAPMGETFGILTVIGTGFIDWPPLLVKPTRAAALATKALAVVWGLPAFECDGRGRVDVEYQDERVEALDLDNKDAQLVRQRLDDDCTWWTLPGNVERASARGKDYWGDE